MGEGLWWEGPSPPPASRFSPVSPHFPHRLSSRKGRARSLHACDSVPCCQLALPCAFVTRPPVSFQLEVSRARRAAP